MSDRIVVKRVKDVKQGNLILVKLNPQERNSQSRLYIDMEEKKSLWTKNWYNQLDYKINCINRVDRDYILCSLK